jgi:hypothetical protein
MLEGAVRRMRALTGFDRAVLRLGNDRIESSRSKMPELEVTGELPPIVADCDASPVGLFPHNDQDPVSKALLRSPTVQQLEELRAAGVRSVLRVPIVRGGEEMGYFECDNRTARRPSFELHAAAELFAQIFEMLLPR